MVSSLTHCIIIGAAKCGTTTLFDILAEHPEIAVPKVKELHYFNVKRNDYSSEEYFSNFRIDQLSRITLESTPAYLRNYREVPERIVRFPYSKKYKFIVLTRDPLERAYSHYLHMVRKGKEKREFKEAFWADALGDTRNSIVDWYRYRDDGLYAKQLKEWLKYFDIRNFMFLDSDELACNPVDVTNRIMNWLDVSEDELDYNKKSNVARLPKNKTVASFLNGDHFFKNILKAIFPIELGRKLKDYLNEKNYRVVEKADIHDVYDQHVISEMRKYFQSDQIEYRSLTQSDD